MIENTDINLNTISNFQLLKQTFRGPDGTIRGSHFDPDRAWFEIKSTVTGAAKLINYEHLLKTDPEKAKTHELSTYFSPEITPRADAEAGCGFAQPFRRHEMFEREGKFIHTLRNMDVETIGEVQDLIRIYISNVGWLAGKESGELRYFAPIHDNLADTLKLTLEGTESEKSEKAEVLLRDFGMDVVYHRFAVHFFENSPEIVEMFINSPHFDELSRQFKKAHVGAAIESDSTVAVAMLSGHFLNEFECINPSTSPSQRFIKNAQVYHSQISHFLSENIPSEVLPPQSTGNKEHDLTAFWHSLNKLVIGKYLPDGFRGTPEDVTAYKEYMEEVDKIMTDVPVADIITDPEYRNMLIMYYKSTIYRRIVDEIHRGVIEKEILRRANEALKSVAASGDPDGKGILNSLRETVLNRTVRRVVIDPDYRRNIIQTAIANVTMGIAVTDKGPVYATSRWMPKAEGYIGRDNPDLPEIEPSTEVPSDTEMIAIIRDVFNGQPNTIPGSEFFAQTQKIYDYAPQILSYLLFSDRVPAELKRKMETAVDTEKLMKKVAKRFGHISDNDLNVVNKFYTEGGIDTARKVILYRHIFEFLEGIETNVILFEKGNPVKKAGRVIGGLWTNEDFSGVTSEVLAKSIWQTLTDGENQILLYDNKLKGEDRARVMKLAANRRKKAEKYLWDGYDTRYLRWAPRRGSDDNLLQIAIECLCPLRDTYLNPRVVQQW